jgi:dephospho-CoA kinase
MTRVVVGLAGRRGSGKSTIAHTLERKFDFARASFGDYVRIVARERGMGSDTQSLQNLGQMLIEELGWNRFCRAVLVGTESAHRVVVDGIRHLAARSTLENLVAPAYFGLVFVETDEALRVQRLRGRASVEESKLTKEMSDELEQLQFEANLVVDGARIDAARAIFSWTTLLPNGDR